MSFKQLFKRTSPVPQSVAADAAVSPSLSAPAPIAAAGETGERSHREIMFVMTALMISMLLAALDQSIVATALPRIASDLNGLTKLSWVATAYLITSAIATPIYGKLGDLYGRKKVFQTAIVLFLVGSALCGLSRTMNELVFFRALQGIGAGGLMSLVLAIIGDIIPPRQRGRYQGYFGAVFGLSSVAGPVLGGVLANAHTFLGVAGWRWIFYINLPLGVVALTLVASRLHLPVRKQEHKIDYLGAMLLVIAVISLIFVSVWAGIDYAWGSWQILSLIASTVVFTILFVLRERRAAEPIIPLGLFKNGIFTASSALSFLAGITMFAAILYIPEYQQIVRGDSPTESGLMLLPLVLGLLVASIVSGRLISKTGHYRPFPIIGTFIMTIGLWLFSHVSLASSPVELSLWMLVLGIGIGMFMQVATLAVQNSTPRQNLGTATSTVTFFRTIGSALGGAIFGTILTSRLTHHLHELLPGNAGGKIAASGLSGGTKQLAAATPLVRHDVLLAFVQAFHDMFLITIPFAVAALIVALLLREAPLGNTTKDMAAGEGFTGGH